MTVEPDGPQPIDDDNKTVGPDEQTLNVDRSFDRSVPPDATSGQPSRNKSDSEKQIDDDGKRTVGPADTTLKAERASDQSAPSDVESGNEAPAHSNHQETVGDDSIALDRTANHATGKPLGDSSAGGKSDPGHEPSMSILQTVRSIAKQPATTPGDKDATGAEPESKPDTADDAFDRSYPIGRYQVRRLLGQGAFGRVYEAHDPQLDRMVAVKVSKELKGRDEVNRFLREARSAAHLRHPNIIPVFEYGQIDDLSMIVYELVDGETLRSYIKRNAPLPLSETITIIRKIANGLDYAHREGIIHRDMKPDNVLIDKKGEPHIADFGCARRSDDQDMHQTIEGSILGTPMYMSPEQASGKAHQADGRTDVWSLGVMMYEMVSGEKPFQGKLSDLLHLIRHHDPKPLRKVDSSTPRDIETICSRCLRRELDARFATAGQLADELERFERGEPILSRRISVITRTWLWAKRNRAVASLLSAVVATLLLGISVSSYFMFKAENALELKEAAESKRASTSLNSLTDVDSSKLDNILNDLELSSSSMLERIGTRLAEAETARDERKQRRLSIALLHLVNEKERARWFNEPTNLDMLLSADGGELVSFCNECWNDEKVDLIPDIRENLVPDLWSITRNTNESNERRFRAACALAKLDPPPALPESSDWNRIAPDVAGYLTAMNQIEVSEWLPLVAPIQERMKLELLRIFKEDRTLDNSAPETAAAVLSSLFADNVEYIVNTLVPLADARQLAQLMTSLEKQEPRKAITDLLTRRSENLDSTVETGTEFPEKRVIEKANLVLARIQLSDLDAWLQLQRRPDNSVSTEVIERIGPASTSVDLLLKEIYSEKFELDTLSVVLLALGQFTDGQIPYTVKSEVILPKLKNIFEKNPDARVHSSARWLMTQWGFDNEVQELENSLKREWPDDGKNWHIDKSGNTFVVFTPGDDFSLGFEWGKRPNHRFGICIHEVTDPQFIEFVDTGYRAGPDGKDNIFWQLQKRRDGGKLEKDLQLPVRDVKYFEALAYCRWLTDKYPLTPNPAVLLSADEFIKLDSDSRGDKDWFDINEYGYRLPTSTEWEYACRAWTNTERSFGNIGERLGQYAWYSSNSENRPHPVAEKKPNEAGLFDMLGNLNEWCLDLYYLDDEGKFEEVDREYRGGTYRRNLKDVKTSLRRSQPAINFGDDLGFRLARTYPPTKGLLLQQVQQQNKDAEADSSNNK